MSKFFSFLRSKRFGASWLSSNIIIPEDESSTVGKYNPRHNPAMTALFDFFTENKFRELHLVKSSQCGASFHVLCNLVHQRTDGIKGNAILVSDSSQNSKDLGERFEQIISASFPLATSYRKRNDKGKVVKRFVDGKVWLLGSGNPGQLASRQAVFLCGDEVDKHKKQSKEANTTALLRQRMKTHKEHGRMFCLSTPTTPDGQIWTNYLMCEHKASPFLQCPHCKEHVDSYEVLDLSDISLRCPSCKVEWTEEERIEAAENPVIKLTSGHGIPSKGMMLGATYSDVANPNVDISEAIRELKRAMIPERKREILQNVFARPHDNEVEIAIKAAQLTITQDKAYNGKLGAKFLGIDVQSDCFKYVQLQEYVEDERFALKIVARGTVSSLSEIQHLIQESKAATIDDGGARTWEVRPIVAQLEGKLLLSKGRGRTTDIYSWRWVKVRKDGQAGNIPLLLFFDDVIKDYAYTMLDNGKVDIGEFIGDREFVNELVAERKAEVFSRHGRPKLEWIVRQKNDYGDAYKMASLLHLIALEHRSRKKGANKPTPAKAESRGRKKSSVASI